MFCRCDSVVYRALLVVVGRSVKGRRVSCLPWQRCKFTRQRIQVHTTCFVVSDAAIQLSRLARRKYSECLYVVLAEYCDTVQAISSVRTARHLKSYCFSSCPRLTCQPSRHIANSQPPLSSPQRTHALPLDPEYRPDWSHNH
jgi:hypothetical protein